jgi:hypothetical protein
MIICHLCKFILVKRVKIAGAAREMALSPLLLGAR